LVVFLLQYWVFRSLITRRLRSAPTVPSLQAQ
jgi:hypothetical protein